MMTMLTICVSAQQKIVFAQGGNLTAAPLCSIDSIKIDTPPRFSLYFKDRIVTINADSVFCRSALSDTLFILFDDQGVQIHNPFANLVQAEVNGDEVRITAKGGHSFVCTATGNCDNGRIVIDSDTTFTLRLSNLNLSSSKSNAISITQKQKARIEIADDTVNSLSNTAFLTDSTDFSNGCLYSRGSLTFAGKGMLHVTGNHRHAIVSGKNITVEEGHLIIYNTVKDCMHCDKFMMARGDIDLHLSSDASKGIKCKEDFTMEGGRIEGIATGNVTIVNADLSYCSLLKVGGKMTMKGGNIHLRHSGTGGRCISTDGDMNITGGAIDLENHGDGGCFFTAEQELDYFTPKCISVNGVAHIERGLLHLQATGNGGKGIDCSDSLYIGRPGDDYLPEDSLCIDIETHGTALVDNVEDDFRKGCPKAVKSDKYITIYSGNLNICTYGQGGEGIESKGTLRVFKATILADTYDDCFNTGVCCHIDGAHIYCLSHNNDGIDSNGSIIISDGIVASVNQTKPNESLDSEDGQLFLLGGTVFGIGSGPVDVEESAFPCYTTPYDDEEEGIRSRGLILTEGKFVCIQKNEEVVMALRNDNKAFRSFVTFMSPSLSDNERLSICEGDCPADTEQSVFEGKLLFGGMASNSRPVTDIQVQNKH